MRKILTTGKRNVKYILRKMAIVEKKTMITYLGLSLITSVLPVFISLKQKDIIDILVNFFSSGEERWSVFYEYCIILAGMLLVMAICEVCIQYINNVSSLKYKRKSMLENVDKMSSLKMAKLENPNVHFLFDLSCEEPNVNPFSIIKPAIIIVTTGIMIISYYMVLLQLNSIIAILPIVLAIPLIIIGNKKEQYEYLSKYDNEIMDLNRRISYFSSIIKEPLYAKDNIVYNIGSYFLKKRKTYKNRMLGKKTKLIKKSVKITAITSLLTLLAQYGIYFVLGINVLNNSITLGSLNLYFNAFTAILLSMNHIIDSSSYVNAQVELEAVKEEFMSLPTIDGKKEKHSLSVKSKHRIRFENVTFAYPGTERKIIDNLSFSIDEDDIVALIGENGSGKSTLIKLLIGQYEPQSGRILIDDVDILEYSQKELASIYGVMFQNVQHIAISIREYVALSEETVDEKLFIEAIEKAECGDILKNAIAKRDTIMGLGLDYAKAKEFSGGEWQRLAMARLFYADPDVFVMDEPTAALDAEAEYRFFENFRKIGKHHQIVMVSHRLSIARLCSKIVYFGDNGIVVDTHNNLLNKVASYKQLYDLQRRMYFAEVD